jgi:hypothetical protein
MWKFWKKTSVPQTKKDARSIRFEQIEQLLRGELSAQVNHPTLLFFTVHKAASSYVGTLLKRIAPKHQIIPIDYMEYLFSEVDNFKGHESRLILESVTVKTGDSHLSAELNARKTQELARLFPECGFQFGPIRVPFLLAELPNLDRYRSLIQLRDPRDCLTSMYFSKAYSHVPPPHPDKKKEFLEKRQQWQKSSIDQDVLKNAPAWVRLYQQYADALQRSPQLSFVKYEQMVLDFPAWLEQVEQAWGFRIETGLRGRLIDEANFNVEQEDIYSHKRQVIPGDHLRKLQPETIRQLTDMFAPVLTVLGYPLEAESAWAA